MTYPSRFDRLLMGSPLRRESVSRRTAITLFCTLAFAAAVQLALILAMPPYELPVFLAALACAAGVRLTPLAVLWYLDRREREAAGLLAAAFLWGGLIATGLALPFNTAFFHI